MTDYIRKRATALVALALVLLAPVAVRAQYYDWGQDPASVKWRVVRTPYIKYIFPDNYGGQASRVINVMDTVRPYISHGFTHPPMRRVPLVMHTQNFNPNGIVMLAPRRIELITTPEAKPFAFPAYKQLAVHEYRHAVQYNNLNRGLIRALSYVAGQQGELVGLAFMPFWAMEGDAVMAETQMSSFGRGVQPSFSIEYRAMMLEGRGRDYPIDKFFCGSYRDYMPDHYRLGYQIVSWAWERYGENFLDKTSRYAARNPYMIAPFSIALKKYYGTTTGRMFRDAFDALEEHWRSLPEEDVNTIVIPTPITSYTVYSSPREVGCGKAIVALKSDLDRPSRLVSADREGNERTLCNTGVVNSPLAVMDSTVYWTELRQSTFWEQRVGSVLCSFDLATGRRRVHHERRNVLFPAAAGDTIAAVEYLPEGVYRIGGCTLPDSISVHGLAWSRRDEHLYFISLSDAGMWIGAVEGAGFRQVTQPTRAAISDLTAEYNLYFTSNATGRDEVHMYNQQLGVEFRYTWSRYGSFSPSRFGPGLVFTTYTADGYRLAVNKVPPSDVERRERLSHIDIPRDVMNPARPRWEVPNMDSITVAGTTGYEVKKYRKGLNLFYFHSWMPACFEPDRVMSETRLDVQAGAVLMSQNNLNSAYTELGYGWTGAHSVAHAKFKYLGWAPKVEIDMRWSDIPQAVGGRTSTDDPMPERLSDYIELSAFAYLPARLSSGASLRTLTPTAEWTYDNMKLFKPSTGKYNTGLHKLSLGLQYAESRRMAHRDFLPRLGYAARVNYTFAPLDDDFGKLWSLFGRVYLPGVAPHHSLMLRGAWQRQGGARYSFSQKELFPRGAAYTSLGPRRYHAAAVDYQLPVWYPDGGVNSLLYFRRVRLGGAADWARYRTFRNPAWRTVWSYGADVTIDVSPLRLPAVTSTAVTFSVRKASDSGKPWFGFGISMPI